MPSAFCRAATMPATKVPWPMVSVRALPPTKLRAPTIWSFRSGWSPSIPESMIATERAGERRLVGPGVEGPDPAEVPLLRRERVGGREREPPLAVQPLDVLNAGETPEAADSGRAQCQRAQRRALVRDAAAGGLLELGGDSSFRDTGSEADREPRGVRRDGDGEGGRRGGRRRRGPSRRDDQRLRQAGGVARPRRQLGPVRPGLKDEIRAERAGAVHAGLHGPDPAGAVEPLHGDRRAGERRPNRADDRRRARRRAPASAAARPRGAPTARRPSRLRDGSPRSSGPSPAP